MKKFISAFLIVLLFSTQAFAKVEYKELSRVAEGEALKITAEFYVGATTQQVEVPIFGTYDEAYISQSLSNRALSIESDLPGGLAYEAREVRKAGAINAAKNNGAKNKVTVKP